MIKRIVVIWDMILVVRQKGIDIEEESDVQNPKDEIYNLQQKTSTDKAVTGSGVSN